MIVWKHVKFDYCILVMLCLPMVFNIAKLVYIICLMAKNIKIVKSGLLLILQVHIKLMCSHPLLRK